MQISKNYIESLQKILSKDDYARAVILANAERNASLAVQEESTDANLKSWNLSRNLLERFIAKALIVNQPDAAAVDGPRVLENKTVAVAFLNDDGWKIGKSKLYADAKKGLLRVNADGTVNEAEAIAYANKYLDKAIAPDTVSAEELLRNKAEAEVALLRTREGKLRYEHEVAQGKYLAKDDVRLETAVKIATLEAGFKNAVRSHADEWLHRAGGDASRAGLLCDLIYAEIDKVLDDFGNMPEINLFIRKE